MYFSRLIAWGIALCLAVGVSNAQDVATPPPSSPSKVIPIEISADGENSVNADTAVATVNVVVHYGDDVLYADRVTYYRKTHEALADGDVRLYADGRVYRGRMLRYNFDTKKVDSNDFAMVKYPVVSAGNKVTSPAENLYEIKQGFFTTDNRQNPAYRLKASTIRIYPDDRVVMLNAVLYIGDIPIAYVPYFEQDLKSHSATWSFQFGNSTEFGVFSYISYNWTVNPQLRISFDLDIRQNRGLGGGVDMAYKPVADGEGLFKSYYGHDDEFGYNPSAQVRTPLYADRYRFSLQQRAPLGADVTTMLNLNVLSDPYVTEDFFKNEFATDRMPDNVAEGVYYNPNFTASILGREQINRFYNSVEEFPGVTLDFKRVKLFNSDFAYEGQTSMVDFRKQFSNQNSVVGAPMVPPYNYGAYRWDTFHQILYPKEYFGWLSVTPRIGGRLTEWSNDNEQPPDQGKNAVGRAVFLVGNEASFKLSQTWGDVHNNVFAIDGLRHVVEPFVNMQYIPRPDINPTQINGFDTRVPNVWAQPINLTSYNSIDSIDRQAVIRYGMRNKLQTKRDGENVDLVDWSLFTDLNMDRHYNEMYQETNDKFSNVYNDITVKPLPWLSFRSQSSLKVESDSYDMSDNGITWQATKYYKVTVGNRYLNNATMILDNYGVPIGNSDLLYLQNFYRINEHWQVEAKQQFESSSGHLQEQDYTVYRDLETWQMAMTYSEQEYPDRPTNRSIFLQMTLKAFPEAKFSFSE